MQLAVCVDARFSSRLKGGDRCRFELLQQLRGRPDLDLTAVVGPDGVDLVGDLAVVVQPHRPTQHPQADVFEQLTLPRAVRRLGPQVYHGTFQSLPGLLRPAPRTVLTVHDTALYDRPELFSRQFRALARPQLAASVRAADHVVCVTEATRRAVEDRWPRTRGRTSVVLNGVGEEFHPRGPELVEQRLDELGVPRPYVLFVGNHEPKKNLPRLTAAFALLQDLPHHLVLAGTRPEGSTAETLTPSPRLHALGFVGEDDLPVLYAGAALIAYPSTYEGFGMPVLEGMASGVPVLTSDASCLPEVAGGAALLVDPLDVESLADGLRRALLDQPWRTGAVAAGLARARQLSWQAHADAVVEVYRSLL